jgi:hypothetical protein
VHPLSSFPFSSSHLHVLHLPLPLPPRLGFLAGLRSIAVNAGHLDLHIKQLEDVLEGASQYRSYFSSLAFHWQGRNTGLEDHAELGEGGRKVRYRSEPTYELLHLLLQSRGKGGKGNWASGCGHEICSHCGEVGSVLGWEIYREVGVISRCHRYIEGEEPWVDLEGMEERSGMWVVCFLLVMEECLNGDQITHFKFEIRRVRPNTP